MDAEASLTLRIATRRSELAIWQAEYVARQCGLPYEIVGLESEGDRLSGHSLREIGGQGVFSKEIQRAVVEGRADIAVHSAKDLPTTDVDGLCIGAFAERADPRDAVAGLRLGEVPQGGRVGTSSARRRCQILALRPDVDVVELRGNMRTRLGRTREFDAVIVAYAAMERLGLEGSISEVLPVESFCPQVGQGALAVECRVDDVVTAEVLRGIDHGNTHKAVVAERAMLRAFGTGCSLPIGAHAVVADDGIITAFGMVGMLDGSLVLRGAVEGSRPEDVGTALAEQLISMGAGNLI